MKVLRIAAREFASTAMTKGFIIGAFVFPGIIMVVMAVLMPILLSQGATAVSGKVAVIDPTGRLGESIGVRLLPESERKELAEEAQRQAAEIQERFDTELPMGQIEQAIPIDESVFEVEVLPADADVEAEAATLVNQAEGSRLAVVKISEHAISKGEDGYGGYTIYHRPRLDARHVDRMKRAVEGAIRDARAEEFGIAVDELRDLFQVRAEATLEMTEEGEAKKSIGELKMMISFGYMFLIFLPVIMGTQFLLTTMIEEKSSRVVEVLLSAVSPMQLMSGKILGQFAVGLTILLIYGGLGVSSLLLTPLAHHFSFTDGLFLVAFFLIAYFSIAALTAAVGSAVNDLREAQSLQTPIMLVLILPYLLSMPIARNPSSTFSVVASMTPLINPFAMILRVTSNEPPPIWQVLVSIVIGVVTVLACLWVAAKIFRVGLLMYGKPPNFATLVKWVRMA
jgi:ABC-type Na+ efflux pump permease subunit